MAGGAIGDHLQQKGISIAVQPRFLEVQIVAGDLPLVPQVLAAAAVEPDLNTLHGALERPGVHVAEHEHLAGVHILGYGGD